MKLLWSALMLLAACTSPLPDVGLVTGAKFGCPCADGFDCVGGLCVAKATVADALAEVTDPGTVGDVQADALPVPDDVVDAGVAEAITDVAEADVAIEEVTDGQVADETDADGGADSGPDVAVDVDVDIDVADDTTDVPDGVPFDVKICVPAKEMCNGEDDDCDARRTRTSTRLWRLATTWACALRPRRRSVRLDSGVVLTPGLVTRPSKRPVTARTTTVTVRRTSRSRTWARRATARTRICA